MGFERPFQLEGLRVNPLTGEITGPGGREQLDPKVMDVLVYMAEHAGHVVSREVLHDRLWSNAVVTDDALNRCFYELRRQLCLAGGDDRYRELIETLPKRGYRLNGTVAPLPAESGTQPAGPSRRRRLAIAAGILGAVAVAVFIAKRSAETQPETPSAATADSIAVLPFVDMSAEQDQAYLSDGISEEILNRLAKLEGLRVIARTSSFALRDPTLDVSQIAERLQVAYVLEGSVRKSGERVRVTAQLITASDNSHVWSETYDRNLGDLFAIQDEIAGAVATALKVTLAGNAADGRRTVNAEAHLQFLQGQFFYNRRVPGDIPRSVEYYEKALAIDPGYARAWAALSGACGLQAEAPGEDPAAWLKRQGDAALRAVELDPGLAVAQSRLSRYYFRIGDRERGRKHADLAVALDPDDLLVLGSIGGLALWAGDVEKAVAAQRRAVTLDPLSYVQRGNLGSFLTAAGRLDEALVEYRNAQALNPESDVAFGIAQLLAIQGRYDEARAVVTRMPEGRLRDQATAFLHRAPGMQTEADAALQRLAAHPRVAQGARDAIRLAEAYAFRGRADEAFAVLQGERRAFALDAASFPNRIWDLRQSLNGSHVLKPLHADPRWAALIQPPG